VKIKISVFLAVCLCLCLATCKSPASSTPVYPPKPGDWTASTAFGTLDFTVNSASTYITKFTITYNNWKGRSGSVIVSQDPGWAISGRTFKIEDTLSGYIPEQWTIDGTFESSGDKASGTWKVVIGGQTESGSWQASPKS
jgi:hypothetical protein